VASKSYIENATSKFIDIAEELSFEPSPAQRKLKAKYWLAVRDYPGSAADKLSCAEAMRVTNDGRLERWWKSPGFAQWFRGRDEFRERTEYLCQLALDTAEQVLLSDDPKAINAKVSMIKVLLEAGGKITKSKEIKLLDESVSKMNKPQLEEYLRKAQLLPEGRSNDNGPTEEADEAEATNDSDDSGQEV